MKGEIEAHIKKLSAEVETLPAAEAERLRGIVQQLEIDLAGRSADTPIDALRRTLEAFEVEHPRATAIVNDLIIKLESMGI